MKKSIDLMKSSIDEFSTFYQTTGLKEKFFIKQTILNVVEILNAKIVLKKVKMQYDIEDDFELFSYEHILSNIFLILINNSLEAFDTKENNFIKIGIKKSLQKVVISCEDNAGGINIVPIEKVFEYFVSSKPNDKSSGIGLSVAKLLINEKLKGEISVRNSEKGAIFTIII